MTTKNIGEKQAAELMTPHLKNTAKNELRPAIISQDEWEVMAALGGQLTLRQTREILLAIKKQRDAALRIVRVMETWMNAGSAEIHFETLMPNGDDENETVGLAVAQCLNLVEGK